MRMNMNMNMNTSKISLVKTFVHPQIAKVDVVANTPVLVESLRTLLFVVVLVLAVSKATFDISLLVFQFIYKTFRMQEVLSTALDKIGSVFVFTTDSLIVFGYMLVYLVRSIKMLYFGR
jgi:hypothetical protein